MESSARFCENCGQPLTPQSKFCGSCGQPVKPLPACWPVAPTPTPPPAAQSGYPLPELRAPAGVELRAPAGVQPPFDPSSPLPQAPQAGFYPPQPPAFDPFSQPPQAPQAGFYPPQPPAFDPFSHPPQAPQAGFYPPQPPAFDPFSSPLQTPQGGYYPPPEPRAPAGVPQPNSDPFAPPPPAYPYPQQPGGYPPPALQAPEGMPQPGYPQEQICGVIPGASRKKGFMGMNADNYVLVVTNQRILFATQSKEIMQQQIEQARQAAKSQGKNFLSQWGAQLTANNGQRYLQMDPAAALAEHPDNFFYLNAQIRSVRFSRYQDDETNRTDYTIELDTVAGKVKLNLFALNEHEAKNLLRSTLGNIIR